MTAPALLRFALRRTFRALLLVIAAASAAMLLVHLAPGDTFSIFGVDPATADAERARLGLDRPFVQQYGAWLSRAIVLDLGESARFNRPVAALLGERLGNTALLGCAALVIALGLGLPAGVVTGSNRRAPAARLLRAVSLLFLATPPLVTALVLLVLAALSGWPAGGFGASADGAMDLVRRLAVPALALGLPIAASLERLQSQAIGDALGDPSIAAARARGVSRRRATWVHALRLSAPPVLGVLGIVIGAVLSGSFVVEIVMSWPGIAGLMVEAVLSRDVTLAAGCASVAAALLAIGIVASDIALAVADPRTRLA
jgi:peptide/nickel transport system permease protein